MDKPFINKLDNSGYNINFLTGIYCLWGSQYTQAIEFFNNAVSETDPLEKMYSTYLSYLGLTTVLTHQKCGLHQCYQSTDTRSPTKPEILLNLACAEFISDNRRRGIQAIDKFDRIKSVKGSEEINSFFNIVGKRERNTKGLPKRNHFINKTLGGMFRKRESVDKAQIKAFIRETAKSRYKGIMLNLV